VRRPNGGGAGDGEFYLRYYVGHKGKFGHEFLDCGCVVTTTFDLLAASSPPQITKEDDSNCPEPGRVDPQELEIVNGPRAHLLHHIQDCAPPRVDAQLLVLTALSRL
jgi:protein mago nashi